MRCEADIVINGTRQVKQKVRDEHHGSLATCAKCPVEATHLRVPDVPKRLIADDDQAFGVIRHTEMSSHDWAFCASRKAPVMLVTHLLLDLSGPVYNNVRLAAHAVLSRGRALPMQETVANAAQTQQWSFVLQQLVQWVVAGVAWIVPFQAKIFGFVLQGETFWNLAGMSLLLLLPAAAFSAGIWGTMVSLYTIPFRLGRSGTLMQSIALAWWDALRMVWFYWAGLVKFLIVLVGWVWGLLKLSARLVVGTIKSAITSPLAVLDATSRRPGVPWAA